MQGFSELTLSVRHVCSYF